MKHSIRSGVAGLILALALLMEGCAPQQGLRPTDLRSAYQDGGRSALGSNELSRANHAFLGRRGLAEATVQEAFDSLVAEMQHEDHKPLAQRRFAVAELAYREASGASGDEAASLHLTAALLAYLSMLGDQPDASLSHYDPRFGMARDIYRLSLASVTAWLWERRDQLADGVTVPWLGGQIVVRSGDSQVDWCSPEVSELISCDLQEVAGLEYRSRSAGLGSPVAVRRTTVPVADPSLPRNTPVRPGTLLFVPSDVGVRAWTPGGTIECEISCFDPLATPHVTLRGQSVPLETDLITPLALLLDSGKRVDGMQGLLNARSEQGRGGLYLLQPYRPDAIPVVLVHGLMSTPRTWLPMVDALLTSPELSVEMQFWLFLYPTGNPIFMSAANLRDSLLGARRALDPSGTNPDFDRTVIIGHSMGGILARLMVQEGGPDLWASLTDRPLADCGLEPADVAEVQRQLFYDPVPFIARAAFLAAPHRGSPVADSGLGSFGASLVELPDEVTARWNRLAATAGIAEHLTGVLAPGKAANGISSLSQHNPVLLTSADKPIRLPFHTIRGERRPGEESDGLVPFASAHLDGAESEMTIRSDHGVHTRPQAIAEVRRILKEHLGAR